MKKISKFLFILSFISLFCAVGGMDGGSISITVGMVWGLLSIVGAAVFGRMGGLCNT